MTRTKAAIVAKERPLLYSGAMVRAILAGVKTQTRRVINPQPETHQGESGTQFHHQGWSLGIGAAKYLEYCPHGQPGNRLWVREAWRTHERPEDMVDGVLLAADGAFNRIENTRKAADAWVVANNNGMHGTNWRPSIHMPRWASRITLEITGVRIEQVQSISQADAIAEGVGEYVKSLGSPTSIPANPVNTFARLWEEINGPRGYGWASNPWTWVIDFRRLEPG